MLEPPEEFPWKSTASPQQKRQHLFRGISMKSPTSHHLGVEHYEELKFRCREELGKAKLSPNWFRGKLAGKRKWAILDLNQ